MKVISMRCLMATVAGCAVAEAMHTRSEANPLGKVLELISGLESQLRADGERDEKTYHEYYEWCDETAHNTINEISTSKETKASLEAKIDKLSSDIEVATTRIDDLASAIGKADGEMKKATTMRKKEAEDFSANEKELMEAVDTLDRASTILQKEMSKASFAQLDTSSMRNTLSAMATVLEAAGFSGADQQKLSALVQEHSDSMEDDQELGAPAAAAYNSHSGGILDILEDMKEKAEGQLNDLRRAETESKHNYDMLAQSIKDQGNADQNDLDKNKANKAQASEEKAGAEGELQVTTKKLGSGEKELADVQSQCIAVAADHEATMAARMEELKTLGSAKKMLEETTGGAEKQSYSFVQVAAESTKGHSRVLIALKSLAKQHHSAALAQLASHVAGVLRHRQGSNEDVFAKIKALISDMIAKLTQEASAEATEKAYCDEQLSKSGARKEELEEDIGKMTAKVDQAVAGSAQLKEQVQELENELALLAKEQAEMDRLRSKTYAAYSVAKADLEKGLAGVRKALGVLRDYYASDDSDKGAALLQDDSSFTDMMSQPAKPQNFEKKAGAGQSVIGILEVIESDFAKNLAKEESEESDSQSAYDKLTQENKVIKTTKEQDVKYKTQASKSLDKTTAEISSDRSTDQSELDAVDQYLAQLKDRCVAKPETYEERVNRRAAEINGLKEALQILQDEAALVQRNRHGRAGRHAAHHHALRGAAAEESA